MASPENSTPMQGGERSWWRFLLGPLLLTGLAFLIWQNRSLARQVADLESSLKELDSRVELSAERIRAVPALRPSLTINPGLADEIAERVLARMSVPAKPAEPKRPAGGEKGIAQVSASEDRANTIVDAAIRSDKRMCSRSARYWRSPAIPRHFDALELELRPRSIAMRFSPNRPR